MVSHAQPFVCVQFLDTVTGTYRYYHSPTNRVHLYPPEVSVSQVPASMAKAKPTEAAETDREKEREQSKLKRSYSSPDISQELNAETSRKPTPVPQINRENKYAHTHTHTCSFFTDVINKHACVPAGLWLLLLPPHIRLRSLGRLQQRSGT